MLIGEQALNVLRSHRPDERQEVSLLQAAVAIILRDTELGTECLMMQRAEHEHDPWSGQMAFPGGKIDPGDVDARAAAVRETREEVGVDLRSNDYVGRLDDLYGLKMQGTFSVKVSCFVFKPRRELNLVANHEVADMVWLPLSYLSEPGNARDFTHPKMQSLTVPSVVIDDTKAQVLWGLSLRMLVNMYELLNLPMTSLSEHQYAQLKGIENQEIEPDNLDSITQKIVDRRR